MATELTAGQEAYNLIDHYRKHASEYTVETCHECRKADEMTCKACRHRMLDHSSPFTASHSGRDCAICDCSKLKL